MISSSILFSSALFLSWILSSIILSYSLCNDFLLYPLLFSSLLVLDPLLNHPLFSLFLPQSFLQTFLLSPHFFCSPFNSPPLPHIFLDPSSFLLGLTMFPLIVQMSVSVLH